ncbi:MAG: metallophosphoesterase family protein [Acidobacteriota bacterium]
MRYLVLTDIHANVEALDACLADASRRGYDAALVLGDVVGYGADPNAVVEKIIALAPAALVRGNHDKVAAGLEGADGFNAVAKAAALWTLDTLTSGHRDWLAALPTGPSLVDAAVEICHGSPYDEDAYLFDAVAAARALRAARHPICLFGHTHQPVVFEQSPKGTSSARLSESGETRLRLRAGGKYLVNPGAVGQPRDGDPRAAYALLDTDRRTLDLIRVSYPVADAQEKIRKAGLPDALALRLANGR